MTFSFVKVLRGEKHPQNNLFRGLLSTLSLGKLLCDTCLCKFLMWMNQMEAVKRAKGRFQRYPRLLALCASESNAYAMCVLAAHEGGGPRGTGVTKGHCDMEFQALKRCAQEAARKAGTRM